jgi:ABC-type antimicrobial peptide transport system permease subunit
MLALALAVIGLYGVMRYSVARRTHEFGIRMALGATGGEVTRLVMGEGLRLAVAGVATGLVAAAVLMRGIARLLYGVRPGDVASFAGPALMLFVVALAASALPVWRAIRANPVAALRQE